MLNRTLNIGITILSRLSAHLLLLHLRLLLIDDVFDFEILENKDKVDPTRNSTTTYFTGCKLALFPDFHPKFVEDKWNRHHQARNTANESAGPLHVECVKHLSRKQSYITFVSILQGEGRKEWTHEKLRPLHFEKLCWQQEQTPRIT